jgi:hypothetical protein
MFKLRHRKFTKEEAGIEEGSDTTLTGSSMSRRQNTRRNEPFSKLITNGEEFGFDFNGMRHIRIEYKTLIGNLHPLYDQFYIKRLEKEKKEKAKRKMKQARKRKRNPAQVINV